MKKDDEVSGAPRSVLRGWALASALVVLLAFGGLVVFMISIADADEVKWSRLAWVFASVEAIAFGAAGALFGSKALPSRGRVGILFGRSFRLLGSIPLDTRSERFKSPCTRNGRVRLEEAGKVSRRQIPLRSSR